MVLATCGERRSRMDRLGSALIGLSETMEEMSS